MIDIRENWKRSKHECNHFGVIDFLDELQARIDAEMGDIAKGNYIAGFKEGEEKQIREQQARINKDRIEYAIGVLELMERMDVNKSGCLDTTYIILKISELRKERKALDEQ